MGGQTALNVAMKLHENGVLEKYGVELIGADARAIEMAEDREQFARSDEADRARGAARRIRDDLDEALEIVEHDRLPGDHPARRSRSAAPAAASRTTARSSRTIVRRGLELSPINQVLIERSVIGWKEFELEVMRDGADNVIIVCSIENFDPMGVHTGDSITVAPAMTLTDREYQQMRDAAIAIIREIGVEAGGCNIQFAVNPADGEMLVIEMNPRVSRSSALASKATGFPIARIGAKLAVGYRLDELPNDITKTTPASFEPVLDYVVVKFPRFAFEKFPDRRSDAHDADEVGRRVDGDRPHLQGGVAEGAARRSRSTAPAGRPARARRTTACADDTLETLRGSAAAADAGAHLPGQARARGGPRRRRDLRADGDRPVVPLPDGRAARGGERVSPRCAGVDAAMLCAA